MLEILNESLVLNPQQGRDRRINCIVAVCLLLCDRHYRTYQAPKEKGPAKSRFTRPENTTFPAKHKGYLIADC